MGLAVPQVINKAVQTMVAHHPQSWLGHLLWNRTADVAGQLSTLDAVQSAGRPFLQAEDEGDAPSEEDSIFSTMKTYFMSNNILAAATIPHQVYQKASINSQIETDSSIHTAARSKDIREISTHLSFAKFRGELSEMRRDVPPPHPSSLIGKDDRLDVIRILSGPLTSSGQ
ncbi:hypothetical protein CDAR_365081 [Caerostris darwini]|uniref:Uncharacterized protein n=1 Tax=Caerostris darwini TaxID=1538125 RepID=A0AAV4S695_9ARAC|nr:hypothetical protein CDAR_365081 [Caerostris darwini]